jgi:hypothetical protein
VLDPSVNPARSAESLSGASARPITKHPAHGRKIHAESRPGGGAIFAFPLPVQGQG